MQPIHIIGHGGTGKTTLIVDLIRELTLRGIRVGTLKHSTHVHELDKPGKDTFLHRQAGASPVTMMTKELCAVYLPRTDRTTPQQLLDTYYTDADLVLIEGWISGPYPKIEFFRKEIERQPLFKTISHVKALVCDDDMDQCGLPVLGRGDVTAIADFILSLVNG
jgi:molybdopterin-guanine dinucleotide biosynthesis protein B